MSDARRRIRKTIPLLLLIGLSHAQSSSRVTGLVVDPSGKPISGARIVLRSAATLLEYSATVNRKGVYWISALPAGTYRCVVTAPGFTSFTVEALTTEVARTFVQDVQLKVGELSQEVTIQSESDLIDATTISFGHAIDARTVHTIPLNGRYLLDLAVLVPGSVTPSNGFSTTPSRGVGTLAINTAGNREETVNYMINGITLNDLVFSAILFQPAISTVEAFKIDNSTFSAEYGQSSGAVVNVATRSGGNRFHGELFEFLRNDKLDARNFFTFTSSDPPPFKRNQFGLAVGGPLVKARTFFYVSYEGVRQSQRVDLNSLVLSDAQRASVSGPAANLVRFIPAPNLTDSSGTPRFVGSAAAPVTNDQWGLDISHVLSAADRLHGYYSFNLTRTVEPGSRGNTVPGFGHIQLPARQFFSIADTHSSAQAWINELRLGFNRIASTTEPAAQLNPADFGIRNGINQPIGLPQISVAGGALNFGGPSTFPSGRTDTTLVAGDVWSGVYGRNSLKIGGEFREFLNDNLRVGTGAFTFPTVAAFIDGNANSFSVTLGNQNSNILEGALGLFVQNNFKWRPYLTIELGLRYEWNLTPTERNGKFIVFDPSSGALQHLAAGDPIYQQNNRNFQPRLGFSWDPFHDGKTAVRAGYAILVDQPMTSVVTGAAANPPLATPLTYTGTVRLENAIDLARASGLAPATVDRGFNNAYLQSWNLNLQRELLPHLAVTAGYFGSKGTHLILRRNINQPIDGQRPYPFVAASSSILPGSALANITQVESTGNSNYNALWSSITRRLTRGLQLDASYTWSKSLDYNSLSTQGIVVQNSFNLRADRGPSDFDSRHRFTFSALWELPFRGRLLSDWQFALVGQAQTGNPVNIVTSNTTVNGVAGTLRPNVLGPVAIFGTVDRWFDPSAFSAVAGFGQLGRNVVVGPGFQNADASIAKNLLIGELLRVEFRAEFFDVFNHANLGQPGNVAGTPGFGRITATRFSTGESGSSRQIQFGLRILL